MDVAYSDFFYHLYLFLDAIVSPVPRTKFPLSINGQVDP